MNYGAIKNCDIANGIGVRVSLFVSGCRNHCKGCFQPETWDFNYGDNFTTETSDELIKLLSPDYINGLTILGGDPFEPENQKVLLPFMKRVKETYFTGMFTSAQTDFYIPYVDPESNRLRKYYPDFFAKLDDDSYLILEVKGDHMTDDPVVKAKEAAAETIAAENKMRYELIKSSDIMNGTARI